MTEHRIAMIFASLFAVCFSATVAIGIYWGIIDTKSPIKSISVDLFDVHGNPAKAFRRGETVVLRRESCVLDEGPALYTRTMVHKEKRIVYFMPSGYLMLTKGCRKAYNNITIPDFAELGYYDYVVTVRFVNNPVTETLQELPVPTFEVVR